MPREIFLASVVPVTLETLVDAAVTVDPQLVPRLLFDGAVVQLVDSSDVAVISLDRSRRLDDPGQAELLIGALPTTGAVWWTEATAPWGPAGEPGVRVAQALAAGIDARLRIEDGR